MGEPRPGNEIDGLGVFEAPNTTLFVPPGWHKKIDESTARVQIVERPLTAYQVHSHGTRLLDVCRRANIVGEYS